MDASNETWPSTMEVPTSILTSLPSSYNPVMMADAGIPARYAGESPST